MPSHFKISIFKLFVFIQFLTVLSDSSYAQLDINYYLNKSRQNIIDGDFVEAIRRLNEVIKVRPDQHIAWYYRGISKLQLGDSFGAESDFSATIKIVPAFSEAYYYRGVTEIDRHNYPKALKDIDASIALNPQNPDYYTGRGYIKLMMTDTIGALNDMDSALIIDSKNFKAYFNRSLVKTFQKKYEEAIADCNKAIKIKPFSLEVRLERGRIKSLNDDFNGAMEDLQYVLKKDSLNVLAYYLQAIIFHQKKDYEKAMFCYDKAISINPMNALCFFNRAVLKSELKLYDEALDDYSEVIKINPQNILTYYNRGIVMILKKDFAGAVQNFSKAIELYPELAEAYMNRSSAKMSLGDQLGAFEDKNKADFLMKKPSDSIHTTSSISKEKLMEFKSDFSSIDFETGKIQYKDYLISTFSVYSLVLKSEKNISAGLSKITFQLPIEQLNDKCKIGLQAELSNSFEFLANDSIEKYLGILDSLIKSDSNNCDNYIWKSILYSLSQNYNNAIDEIDKAIKICPSNHLLFFIKGNLLFQIGELINSSNNQNMLLLSADKPNSADKTRNAYYYEKAIQSYMISTLLNPGFSYAFFNKAFAEGMINNISGALNDYSTCLRIDNNFAEAYYNRGLILIYLKDSKNGCFDISKAGELGIKEAYRVMYKYCD